MKILWSLPVRGAHLNSGRGDLVRAKRLIESLQHIGHDVHVVEFASSAAVSVYRKILRGIMPALPAMIIRDIGRWTASIKQARLVALRALAFGAEAIVETQVGFSFSGAIAARKTGLPLILDDCSPSHEEKALGTGLFWLAQDAMRRQAKAALLIVAPSQSIKKDLAEEGILQNKILVLPNGVDLQAYKNVTRSRVRERMGLTDRCVIGFAGSFQPWHATGLLVNALNALRNDSRWHLLLIGDGPRLDSTLQAIRNHGLDGRVTATGSVHPDCMPELISCFDIGVLPGSNDYGHPMKLVEYAAAGVARIGPDLPPVRKIIGDMETGLLFPPNKPDELIYRLQVLLDNDALRNRLGEKARDSVSSRDDWRARARELVLAMEPLLRKHWCGQRQYVAEHSGQALSLRIPSNE